MKERSKPRISRRSILKSAGAVAGASVLPTRRLFAAGKKSIRVLTVADPPLRAGARAAALKPRLERWQNRPVVLGVRPEFFTLCPAGDGTISMSTS